MIQRIQSLLLLVGAFSFLATAFFRSAMVQDAMPWTPMVVLGLHALTAVGALAAIFMYSDRKKQLKAVTMVTYLALAAILAAFGGLYLAGAMTEIPGNTGAIALITLPVVGYILIRWAMVRIRKDIELVRSMDRLR